MTNDSSTISGTRWMVRVQDGVSSQLDENSIREKDRFGRPLFLEFPFDDAALIGQLPPDVAKQLFIPSEDGRGWVLSPVGTEVLGLDTRARQIFKDGQPEYLQILDERKNRLRVLAKDDPQPLTYLLAQLCFRPESIDPRYAEPLRKNRLLRIGEERVLADAQRGVLPVSYIGGQACVRVLNIVQYLADGNPKLYPVCDFLWRYAYRQLIAEGWTPADVGNTQSSRLTTSVVPAASDQSSIGTTLGQPRHAETEVPGKKTQVSKPRAAMTARGGMSKHPSALKRKEKLEALRTSINRMLKEHPEDCEIEEGKPNSTRLVEAMAYSFKDLWPRGYEIPKDLKRWISDTKAILGEGF